MLELYGIYDRGQLLLSLLLTLCVHLRKQRAIQAKNPTGYAPCKPCTLLSLTTIIVTLHNHCHPPQSFLPTTIMMLNSLCCRVDEQAALHRPERAPSLLTAFLYHPTHAVPTK